MKRMILAGLCLSTLAACQKGGEASSSPVAAQCTAPAQKVADIFADQGKLQISIDPNQPSSTAAPQDAQSTLIKAGRELTALVKDSCSQPGAISSTIQLDGLQTPGGVRSYRFKMSKDTNYAELWTAVTNDSCLVGLANAHLAKADSLPNDPLVPQQAHLTNIHASEGYAALAARKSTPKDVVIAIIDTGIDLNHEDLSPNLWVNPGEIPANGIDDDKNGYIDDVYGYNFASNIPSPQVKGTGNQHGTHVAGLAAARSGNGVGGSGVMGTGVKIMALNVFGSSNGANDSDTENAIRYAADNGASVINMSIGGPGDSAAYRSAIAYAISKGVTVFAAAGNSNVELGPNYFISPGSYGVDYDGMMTVGSIDVDDQLSTFSNYSPTMVEIGAPGAENSRAGVGVLSTLPGNNYGRMSGTSMATPVTAGGAAYLIYMMRANGYNPTPAQVEDIFKKSSRVVSGLTNYLYGGRVLDLQATAAYIDQNYPAQPSTGATPGPTPLPGASPGPTPVGNVDQKNQPCPATP